MILQLTGTGIGFAASDILLAAIGKDTLSSSNRRPRFRLLHSHKQARLEEVFIRTVCSYCVLRPLQIRGISTFKMMRMLHELLSRRTIIGVSSASAFCAHASFRDF